MKLARTILFLIAVAAAGTSGAQDVDPALKEWRVSENLSVREIAAGVWMHTSWRELDSGTIFPGNGLLVRGGDALTLIDTAWGNDITEELLGWIDAEVGLPVTQAIVTHFHADSMGGTPALAARGIPVVGHPLTRLLGANEGVPLPDSIGDMEIGDTVTVANVEVFYPGPAHSDDNLIVWVPEAKIVFGSCAVRALSFTSIGNTSHADLDGWPVAIRRVMDRYPTARIVVPGHGEPGDAALLSHTVGLFHE